MIIQGNYEDAASLLERCVDTGQRVLGSGHFDVAVWMENLANILDLVSMQQSVSPGLYACQYYVCSCKNVSGARPACE